jgi:hypothetical protein
MTFTRKAHVFQNWNFFFHTLYSINYGILYRLLQVLIQEMGVNIDLNFVLAVTGLFGGLPNMQTDVSINCLNLLKYVAAFLISTQYRLKSSVQTSNTLTSS